MNERSNSHDLCYRRDFLCVYDASGGNHAMEMEKDRKGQKQMFSSYIKEFEQ